jgi:glutathione synthase/RimK-type ligase-like ATP-grasp enzyme
MLRKIGILHGRENTFPPALIERINSKNEKDIVAEPVMIDKLVQGAATEYAVIIDRISQDVPFYRAYLKNAALGGTAVINNPFWWSADEKFFNNCLCEVTGITVPKTVLLPSHARPDDTDERSFRNLAMPLDFQAIFDYVGFPAFFKPFSGGGWKSVYKVHSAEELFKIWGETGQLVMMLQENINFESYYRCYCLDRKDVLVMPYEPRNHFHERYLRNTEVEPELHKKLVDLVLKINNHLGYDFNTVEIAIRDGVLYPIDFCNPAPDADNFSVGDDNFEWVVEHAAQMAIRKAKEYKPGKQNLTWGEFIQVSAKKGSFKK